MSKSEDEIKRNNDGGLQNQHSPEVLPQDPPGSPANPSNSYFRSIKDVISNLIKYILYFIILIVIICIICIIAFRIILPMGFIIGEWEGAHQLINLQSIICKEHEDVKNHGNERILESSYINQKIYSKFGEFPSLFNAISEIDGKSSRRYVLVAEQSFGKTTSVKKMVSDWCDDLAIENESFRVFKYALQNYLEGQAHEGQAHGNVGWHFLMNNILPAVPKMLYDLPGILSVVIDKCFYNNGTILENINVFLNTFIKLERIPKLIFAFEFRDVVNEKSLSDIIFKIIIKDNTLFMPNNLDNILEREIKRVLLILDDCDEYRKFESEVGVAPEVEAIVKREKTTNIYLNNIILIVTTKQRRADDLLKIPRFKFEKLSLLRYKDTFIENEHEQEPQELNTIVAEELQKQPNISELMELITKECKVGYELIKLQDILCEQDIFCEDILESKYNNHTFYFKSGIFSSLLEVISENNSKTKRYLLVAEQVSKKTTAVKKLQKDWCDNINKENKTVRTFEYAVQNYAEHSHDTCYDLIIKEHINDNKTHFEDMISSYNSTILTKKEKIPNLIFSFHFRNILNISTLADTVFEKIIQNSKHKINKEYLDIILKREVRRILLVLDGWEEYTKLKYTVGSAPEMEAIVNRDEKKNINLILTTTPNEKRTNELRLVPRYGFKKLSLQ